MILAESLGAIADMSQQQDVDRVIWQSYPSWSHFTWLYLFSVLAALRGGLHVLFNVPGGHAWLIGAVLLLACVALVRRWAKYVITPTKVAVRNGYTHRETDAIAHHEISSTTIDQGPIARFFGIGTLCIHAVDDRFVRFRGIHDPAIVQQRIEALRPARASVG